MTVTTALAAKLQQLKTIERKPLRRLRKFRRDDRFLVFGADEHEYRNTPLSPAEIEKFERELGVSLPPAYREFLLQIGPGAGPFYGLFTPERVSNEMRGRDHDPAGDFPLTRADAERLYNQWYAWQQDPELDVPWGDGPPPASGFIWIGHQGCADYTALVTTGELAGTVWDLWVGTSWHPASDRTYVKSHKELIMPQAEQSLGPTPTFDAWYDTWLTRALTALSPGPLTNLDVKRPGFGRGFRL